MRRAHTWKAIRKAREFMYHSGIRSLPVDPFALYKQLGWKLRKNSDIERKYGQKDPFEIKKDKIDAYTYWNGQNFLTVYDESKSVERIRWTLAHEIGHIFLGHLQELSTLSMRSVNGIDEEMYKQLEKEANYFAKELLTPIWLLRESFLLNQEDIALACRVSIPAAAIIESDIQEHGHKTIYTESAAFFRRQFKEFLAPVAVCASSDLEHTFGKYNDNEPLKHLGNLDHLIMDKTGRFALCPHCKNTDHSDHAEFCKSCGLYLFNKQSRKKSWCNAVNPADALFCESCGYQTYTMRQGLLPYWEQILEWNGKKVRKVSF